ncbi:thiamine pyrophosphate-dependent dehydrogenase E1 component subunit alpha, partial [Streptomyces sp. NPDC057474]|uniref:thiamine pyrophosphate-dependent dehydrogenase E1 component subunit alpha n=1 Tax=Streptomyces sp. NPDC057474 TaxID=3346144 RepID=UPI0036BE1646
MKNPTKESQPSGIPAERRADFLELMLLSRECDRRSGIVLRQGEAWFHISSAGHEALAALCELLGPEDLIFPHYRDRTLLLSRGMDPEAQARDLMAKADSHSAGRNMSAHFGHRPGNVFSVASPTGSQCLPAAGAAWAAQLRGRDTAVVCSIGDASTRQGEFFEAVAFAVERHLPVLFLVSDNGYGISTPTAHLTPHALGLLPESRTTTVDGADPDAVYTAAAKALRTVRGGEGPVVLWCGLDRLDAHTSSDDHRVYRSAEDLAAMRDPVDTFAARLLAEGTVDETWLRRTRARHADEVEAVYDRVARESAADPKHIMEHLFAPAGETAGRRAHDAPGEPLTEPCGGAMVAAGNRALATRRARHREHVQFGGDLDDPKGGGV